MISMDKFRQMSKESVRTRPRAARRGNAPQHRGTAAQTLQSPGPRHEHHVRHADGVSAAVNPQDAGRPLRRPLPALRLQDQQLQLMTVRRNRGSSDGILPAHIDDPSRLSRRAVRQPLRRWLTDAQISADPPASHPAPPRPGLRRPLRASRPIFPQADGRGA